MRSLVQPASLVGPEKPKPGREGITRSNASVASAPCARGSESGSITSMNSTIEPGQPCVTTSGSASGSGERTWRKWMFWPSIVVVNWGNRFSRASHARQS